MSTKLKRYIKNLLICSISLGSISLSGQISFPNASFEDAPSDATTPQAWYPCEEMTTPDILPGFWGVYKTANQGETYVGLITRQDGSFESIATRTSKVLKAKTCYKVSVSLAHSKTYAGFNKPLSLRIWAGKRKCDKAELIFESKLIEHSEWRQYQIQFQLEEEAQYILIEAFNGNKSTKLKGNILIDNLTTINSCDRA
jgi:hypothetical protein